MSRRHDLGRLPCRAPALLVAPLVVLAACGPVAQAVAPTVRPTVQITWQPAPSGACTVVDGKAAPRCTPGAINPQVTQANIASTICRKGWTATVRPPESYTENLKRAGLVSYGEHGPLSAFEEDHLIALELGGSPADPGNLWPEPHVVAGNRGSYVKDAEETALNRAVCGGRMTLAAAQARILADWRQ